MTGYPSPSAADDPAPILGLLEGPRFLLELQAFLLCAPWLASAPRGDGHPVMVLPGISAADSSTALVRRFLTERGFAVYGWNFGTNRGLKHIGGLERLQERLRSIHERHGARVSLVGFSLGGSQARRLAAAEPALVRRVITVGSPVREVLPASSTSTAWRIYEHVGGGFVGREVVRRMVADASRDPEAPAVSIFSRTDGVVGSAAAQLAGAPGLGAAADPTGIRRGEPLSENIEVVSGHYGLLVNPSVYYALADRLAEPREGWKPFAPKGFSRVFFGLKPTPRVRPRMEEKLEELKETS